MNRRHFLKLSLAATPLALRSGAAEFGPSSADRSVKGLRVGANADRFGEELLIMGGRFDLKVSAKDTGGELCLYDTTRQSKGGPALHLHHFQDEWFYVIRGEFIVRVGDETMSLHPGDSAFAPRKVPHAFAKVSEAEGQMLVLFQPAGSMEDFFQQMAKFGPTIPQNQEVVWKELWARHGMEVVGPPLKY
jgi:mannose-6-phosphate isomerase-like protein (cupin superfamily)